jgi:hypothetical protein
MQKKEGCSGGMCSSAGCLLFTGKTASFRHSERRPGLTAGQSASGSLIRVQMALWAPGSSWCADPHCAALSLATALRSAAVHSEIPASSDPVAYVLVSLSQCLPDVERSGGIGGCICLLAQQLIKRVWPLTRLACCQTPGGRHALRVPQLVGSKLVSIVFSAAAADWLQPCARACAAG